MNIVKRKYLIVFLVISLVTACTHREPKTTTSFEEAANLLTFEQPSDVAQVTLENAKMDLVGLESEQRLRIQLQSSNHHDASFTLKPNQPWNFSKQRNVAIALDIENPEKSSVHAYIYTYDADGTFQLRNVGIPAESNASYLVELQVPSLHIKSGIRNNPPSWPHDYVQTIWRGGSNLLDVSAISSIRVLISGVLEDKTLIIDNVRAVEPQNFDPQFLSAIVDKFGQNAKQEFANKVHSVDELKRHSQQEQLSLRDTPLTGRSKYNGWADGPRLESTGYFRTEKYNGKWSLVDPEGYLFYSNGIANIRMANTSTITGYDFDTSLIKQREADDFTPEDSIGLNRAPEHSWPTRHVSSELRANMFTWLPTYQSDEAAGFGYRRSVHSGALEHGETYSFYRANLARKYDTNDETSLMQAWRDTTIKRMHSWGMTSFGNWVDPSFYQLNRLPYFANGWIIGDFKTVSSGNDYWGELPDPYDPLFTERVDETVKQIAREVNNNPWCVGVFIDNEKSWGSVGSVQSQYGIILNGLKLDAADSPLKASLVTQLKAQYTSIGALNEAWDTQFSSWAAFAEGVELENYADSAVGDFSVLLQNYAETYFSLIANALDHYMPNHLYMGPRFAHWAMGPEVRAAAAKYADVMSYNYYREGIDQPYWSFLEQLDMPSIIGEFHNGSVDSGLFNPGLIHAESQADRGKKYKEYVLSALDNPYFVGTHWFQYIDSPLTGRAYDGENYNVGFVNVADIPYPPLLEAAKEVNSVLYQRRFKQ